MDRLPAHCLLNIFSNLDVRKLHKDCAKVSQGWNHLSKNASLLPTTINLSNGVRGDDKILEKFHHSLRVVRWCLRLDQEKTGVMFTSLVKCTKLEELHLCIASDFRKGPEALKEMQKKLIDTLPNLSATLKTLDLHISDDCPADLFEAILKLVSQLSIKNFFISLEHLALFPEVNLDPVPTGFLEKFTYKIKNVRNFKMVAEIVAANKSTLAELCVDTLNLAILEEVVKCEKLKKLTFADTLCRTKQRNLFFRYLESLKQTRIKLIKPHEFSAQYKKCNVTSMIIRQSDFGTPYENFDFDFSLNAFNYPNITKLQFECYTSNLVQTNSFTYVFTTQERKELTIRCFKCLDKLFRAALRFPKLNTICFKNLNPLYGSAFFDTVFYNFIQSSRFSFIVENYRNLRRVVLITRIYPSDAKRNKLRPYRNIRVGTNHSANFLQYCEDYHEVILRVNN